ncbi:MAG: hypothetical protein KJ574_03500 [Nanoarchaeota archaeon]|nr:hypothetical protein [Nanoarchaeota archaeon]
MYSWRNYVDKVKTYFKFSKTEIFSLLLTIIVSAFILSFNEWGVKEFNLNYGLFNLFNTILIITVVLLVQESVHRLFALLGGYQVEYKHWTLGLIVGILLVFFSNGVLVFLAPGGILISHLAIHRIGRMTYGPNYKTMGWIAMTGSLSNIFLAILFKIFASVASNSPLFTKAMHIAILFALFNMIPFPPFNGHQLFFGSRYIYMFIAGFVIASSSALYFLSVAGTIISAILFGAMAILLYFVFVDKKFTM